VSGALYGPGCWLTVAVAIAVIFGLSQGHHLGARALSAERDQDTWPLLVVTGMKPHRILVGKFAASFYALSGEWVVTLPFWLLAAALTGNFALPLLAVIQPASIAIGIISGLWLASQPRYLVIHVAKAGAAVAATCIALATFHDMALKALLAMVFEPTAAAFNIATRATSPSTLAHYAVGMALTSIACTLIWRSSETRLRKVMQGE